jgi:hypothetical protein
MKVRISSSTAAMELLNPFHNKSLQYSAASLHRNRQQAFVHFACRSGCPSICTSVHSFMHPVIHLPPALSTMTDWNVFFQTGQAAGPAPQFVRRVQNVPLPGTALYDVVVCGGTLGIFIATSLQLAGFKVAVIERAVLKGREQEWNISRKELDELVRLSRFQWKGCESWMNA